MKKIGFVDYYIGEWHADNYPGWIKEQCEKMGLDYQVCYAWAKKDVSDVSGKTTDQWCADFGVTKCESARELCEKSDYVVILAPSNPEQHLDLVKATFPYAKGKRFYIDKTFAPDLAMAKEIFDLAKKYDVTFFSTSALRYADEIEGHIDCESAVTYGGGGNFEEYVIHQVEMIIKTMGGEIARAKTLNTETGNKCLIEYKDGRNAQMNYSANFGFKIEITENSKVCEKPIVSSFFNTLIKKILWFFETGEIDFDGQQTLAVMALREAVVKSKDNNGEWVEL